MSCCWHFDLRDRIDLTIKRDRDLIVLPCPRFVQPILIIDRDALPPSLSWTIRPTANLDRFNADFLRHIISLQSEAASSKLGYTTVKYAFHSSSFDCPFQATNLRRESDPWSKD